MKMLKEKILAIIIATILLSSTAFSIGALSTVKAATYPISGTRDTYDQATYTAIQQGMYWVGMDANASATRLLMWTRFHDQILTYVYVLTAPDASLTNAIRYQYTLKNRKA